MKIKKFLAALLGPLFFANGCGSLLPVFAENAAPGIELKTSAPVGADGVFVPQLFSSSDALPAVKLCDAPAFGKNLVLTRMQIRELLAANAPDLCTNEFIGAESVKISRRAKTLGESEMLGLLTAALQNNYVKDKGQLELKLAQPWNALLLPDDSLTLDVSEMPGLGVTPNFIVRFTLRNERETLGSWSANVKANVWREVWVAGTQIKKGSALNKSLFSQERRDVLNLREPVADLSVADDALEIAEPVQAGVPLLARMLKARTVIHRGQRAEALLEDGALSVRTKVEILEDGAPGDFVRARNFTNRRELTGKVLNDKTILISL
jgi:flagella basal body P-ring formation protein FlgA